MNKTEEISQQNESSRYWRSLDHKADTPEFREFVEKEFPSGVDLIDDPISRRNFVKIMSASFALAGLGVTGCRRPEHKILICYVSTKKHAIFEMPVDEAIILQEQFKRAAQSFEKLVALVEDPKNLSDFFAPDYSSFYWDDPIVRAEAKRIWGY